jgi:hypothetical protein
MKKITILALLLTSGFISAEITEIGKDTCVKSGGYVKTTRAENQAKICVEGLYSGLAIIDSLSTLECERGNGFVKTTRGEVRAKFCAGGLYSVESVVSTTAKECENAGGYVKTTRSENQAKVCVEGSLNDLLVE